MDNKMYQVSTLQALALGYSRAVVTVGELLREGNTGLGTFEDVNGEMILMDGNCYRADQDGRISRVPAETGVPFAAVGTLHGERRFSLGRMASIDELRTELTQKIEEDFGLNSMHVFDLCIRDADVQLDKISSMMIRLPSEPAFDTYSLKQEHLQEEIKSVE